MCLKENLFIQINQTAGTKIMQFQSFQLLYSMDVNEVGDANHSMQMMFSAQLLI